MTPSERACPAWCIVDHRADPPDDVTPGAPRHRSAATSVAAVVLSDESRSAAAVELVLEANASGGEVWLYVGDGVEQRLELSPESARRVGLELEQLAITVQRG